MYCRLKNLTIFSIHIGIYIFCRNNNCYRFSTPSVVSFFSWVDCSRGVPVVPHIFFDPDALFSTLRTVPSTPRLIPCLKERVLSAWIASRSRKIRQILRDPGLEYFSIVQLLLHLQCKISKQYKFFFFAAKTCFHCYSAYK